MNINPINNLLPFSGKVKMKKMAVQKQIKCCPKEVRGAVADNIKNLKKILKKETPKEKSFDVGFYTYNGRKEQDKPIDLFGTILVSDEKGAFYSRSFWIGYENNAPKENETDNSVDNSAIYRKAFAPMIYDITGNSQYKNPCKHF